MDWSRTRAYALGLSGIYLNLRGREEQGIVSADEAGALKAALARELTGLVDPVWDKVAVRSVLERELAYSGARTPEAPDLLVNCAAGYRISWGTSLGGVSRDLFEDNVKSWGGDHIVDPSLVPGVLFMNRPFAVVQPRLVDLAPTILAALGLSPRRRHGRKFVTTMKILVIGLDCAAPELLFGDERLTNFRRLMEAGCYGRLESVIPPITVPAWMCMSTSQDPGSLGVYGFRNRVDHSYDGLSFVNSQVDHRTGHLGPGGPRGQAVDHHRRAARLPTP